MIVMYHGILDDAIRDPILCRGQVHQAAFEQQIRWLKTHKEIVSLHAYIESLRRGRPTRDSVAITFDDGYANHLTNALPILEAYGAHATFFVPSCLVHETSFLWFNLLKAADYLRHGNSQNLSDRLKNYLPSFNATASRYTVDEIMTHFAWVANAPGVLGSGERVHERTIDEERGGLSHAAGNLPHVIRENLRGLNANEMHRLSASRWAELASHAHSHAELTALAPAKQKKEIVFSRELLNTVSTKPIRYFAYPRGIFTEAMAAEIEAAGYEAAVAVDTAASTSCDDTGSQKRSQQFYALPRLGIFHDSLPRMAWKLRLQSQTGWRRITIDQGLRMVRRLTKGRR